MAKDDNRASVATHGSLLRTIGPLIKSGVLTVDEVDMFIEVIEKVVNRLQNETEKH